MMGITGDLVMLTTSTTEALAWSFNIADAEAFDLPREAGQSLVTVTYTIDRR